MRHLAILILATSCCGCASADKFAAPASWAMIPCPRLDDVPENDGDPKIRRIYYASTRAEYAKCSNRQQYLVSYVRLVRQ